MLEYGFTRSWKSLETKRGDGDGVGNDQWEEVTIVEFSMHSIVAFSQRISK